MDIKDRLRNVDVETLAGESEIGVDAENRLLTCGYGFLPKDIIVKNMTIDEALSKITGYSKKSRRSLLGVMSYHYTHPTYDGDEEFRYLRILDYGDRVVFAVKYWV